MRLATCFCLFLAVSAVAFAQSVETNFSVGPQYLINSSSPYLLRPIATPSLSLSAPTIATPTASPEEGSGEPHTPAFPDLQTQSQIDRIYWGVPNAANGQNGANAQDATSSQASETATLSSESNHERSSVVELSTSQPSQPLPAHFLEVGVISIADSDSLRERGYGMPLGDVAAMLKANKRPAARVYTNADIDRLHGG